MCNPIRWRWLFNLFYFLKKMLTLYVPYVIIYLKGGEEQMGKKKRKKKKKESKINMACKIMVGAGTALMGIAEMIKALK